MYTPLKRSEFDRIMAKAHAERADALARIFSNWFHR